MSNNRKYNRIKIVLAYRDKTIKWLAKQLDMNPNTVSRWSRNQVQPSVEIFYKIAEILKVEVHDLFNTLDKVDEDF